MIDDDPTDEGIKKKQFAEIQRLRAELKDTMEMLLNQARTIKRLQEENDHLQAENAHLKEKLENKMGRLAYYAMMKRRDDAEEAFGEMGYDD